MKGYRTLTVNFLMAIVPVLELVEVIDTLPPEFLPWYALIMVVANTVLRLLTTTPVGQAE